jgi:hypothetical protein
LDDLELRECIGIVMLDFEGFEMTCCAFREHDPFEEQASVLAVRKL